MGYCANCVPVLWKEFKSPDNYYQHACAKESDDMPKNRQIREIFIKGDLKPFQLGESNNFIIRSDCLNLLPGDLVVGLLKDDVRKLSPKQLAEKFDNIKAGKRVEIDVYRPSELLDVVEQAEFAEASKLVKVL